MAITDIKDRLLGDTQTRAAASGRPVVTLSYAQSFDGCLTTLRGERLALSGEESKRMTHQLRAMHEGILVGIGTLLADDPRLTARLAGGPDPQPVILDSRLRIPLESRLLARKDCLPWIVCSSLADEERGERLKKLGARLIVVETDKDGLLQLGRALTSLYEAGLNSLMVEGGARVITSFLRARLADQAVVTIAPVWIGGLPVVENPGLSGFYPCWDNPVVEMFGRDWVVWGGLGEEKYETAGPVFHGTGTG
jgi:riboflavin-specific deaminase-like protein